MQISYEQPKPTVSPRELCIWTATRLAILPAGYFLKMAMLHHTWAALSYLPWWIPFLALVPLAWDILQFLYIRLLGKTVSRWFLFAQWTEEDVPYLIKKTNSGFDFSEVISKPLSIDSAKFKFDSPSCTYKIYRSDINNSYIAAIKKTRYTGSPSLIFRILFPPHDYHESNRKNFFWVLQNQCPHEIVYSYDYKTASTKRESKTPASDDKMEPLDKNAQIQYGRDCLEYLLSEGKKPNEIEMIDAPPEFEEEILKANCKLFRSKIIKTHDQCELETLEIVHPTQASKKKKSEQNYIVYFNTISNLFQHNMDEMREDVNTLQCNALAFNYRGTGKSTGKPASAQDFIADGIALVESLIFKEEADPKNIILSGLSLGGATATLVAKHFHDRGYPIRVFNDRSFSNTTNIIIGWIRGKEGNKLRAALGYLLMPIIKFLVMVTGWEMQAADAFKALPEEDKEYITARTTTKIRTELQQNFKPFTLHTDTSTQPAKAWSESGEESYILIQTESNNKKVPLGCILFVNSQGHRYIFAYPQYINNRLTLGEKWRYRSLLSVLGTRKLNEDEITQMQTLLHSLLSKPPMDDDTLYGGATLHESLRNERRSVKRQKHGWFPDKNCESYQTLKAKFSSRKFRYPPDQTRDVHVAPLKEMINPQGRRAIDFFYDFANRSFEPSSKKMEEKAPLSDTPIITT